MKLPAKGMDKDAVLGKLTEFRANDVSWRDGKTWGYVYDAGKDVEQVAKAAYMDFLSENALDPTVYPSLLRFETEIVDVVREHLRGDEEVVGNYTSGGTESLILAVKTARDWGKAVKGVTEPEMVLPITAHASFHKAAYYLGVKTVITPVDMKTFKADVDAMADAITDNTVLLVGSAASYAHGVVDPIREIGELALKHNTLLHVDGCIGGWLLPYFRKLGESITDFDFSVPGVTSISCDLHKYAYAAKGASTILYKNKEIRKHQIFACSRWTGYTMINNTVQSSKPGGPMAAAWAVMHFIGDSGYTEIAKNLLQATKDLVKGINELDDVYVLGEPEMSLIGSTSDTVSVFHIIDEMKVRGWYIQPQLATGPYRENFHLSVAPSNVPHVPALLADLKDSIEAAKKLPAGALAENVKGMFANFKAEDFTDEMLNNLLGMAGMEGSGVPDRMAEINEVMNALPPDIAEVLLVGFFNNMFQIQR